MLATVDKLLRGIGYIVLAVLIVLAAVMLGVSWAHIYCRYFMNSSLSWSEELLKVLVVWFCLLSATFISLRREHVRITVFKSKMPRPVEKAMDFLVSLLMFVAAAAMVYIGIRLTSFSGMRKTPVLRMQFFYLYSSIYVSFAIIALYELRNFLADLYAPGHPPAMVDAEPSMEALAAAEAEKMAAENAGT